MNACHTACFTHWPHKTHAPGAGHCAPPSVRHARFRAQNPKDKRQIIIDEKLGTLFVKPLNIFSMSKPA